MPNPISDGPGATNGRGLATVTSLLDRCPLDTPKVATMPPAPAPEQIVAARNASLPSNASAREGAAGTTASAGTASAGTATAGANPTVIPLSTKADPASRLAEELGRGATLETAAKRARVSLELAEVMVEHFEREGRLSSATSLCASGLGLCGGGSSAQARLYCAGCPLVP